MNTLKNKKNRILLFLLSLMYVLNFSFISVSAEERAYVQGKAIAYSTETSDANTLSEVKNLINKYYVENVKDKIENTQSINEMITALDDPYSRYFTKEEYESFVNSIDNKFCGIGIYMDIVADGIKVLSTIENSPAVEAGLEAGDIIISADGTSLKGKAVEQASKYLKGEEGSKVNIVVKRGEQFLNFQLIRKIIASPTVTSEVLKDNIGYIRLSSFGVTTAYEFWDKLSKLEDDNVKSYIVDLRYNGGGYVNCALDIGGYFIGEKPMMLMEDNKHNKQTYYATGHPKVIEKPIIFLVNEYSASASEILSAAVKDYGKAFFIGKTTYGKGVAQNMFPLSDGGYIKLTTSKFFSPKGNIIQHVGITPDFHVNKDEDSIQTARLILSNINKDGKLFKLNSKNMKEIVKNKNDKTISITLNKNIDESTVNDKNIELVSGESGEKLPVDFNVTDGRKIVVSLKDGFKKAGNYYFLVNDKIKSNDGTVLSAGAVVKVIVK
ncbi:S41 family peptidase [Clostridium sp. ZS2-4]|uniref:S41 family peptidase n=1 Tax=Clostridium sp. ZS2-4 TaxID=2987703 RepID=UPI00227BC443|nr:S41 family peptidase [Clostridium sp. ZS2-4]MCY6355098.1 S41 family peptidase [Clostridium sp. ZS2-4]